jgi:hypothetical protein
MPLSATFFDPAPFIFVVVSNFDHKSLESVGMPGNADLQRPDNADERCFGGTQSAPSAYQMISVEWQHRRAASAQFDNHPLIRPRRYLLEFAE